MSDAPILPVRASKAELIERFGLNSRLAVRVGALFAKGLGISETVAELAAEDGAMQALLLDARLLGKGGELDIPTLQAAQQSHDDEAQSYFGATPLALSPATFEGKAVQVLCLEEEVLAAGLDSAGGDGDTTAAAPPRQQANTEPEGAPSQPESTDGLRPSSAEGSGGLTLHTGGRSEFVRLFDEEEIARLQVTILTSTNPKEKIEAIRKLRLISLAPNDRASLLLQAIQDDTAEVRREAVQGLTDLGLSHKLSEAVGQLCIGEETERQAILATLERMAASVQSAELRVMYAVLVGTLRGRGMTISLQQGILRTLRAVAPPVAAEDPSALEELCRQLNRLLITRYDDLSAEVYAVYKAVAAASGLVERLRGDFEEATDPRLRAFYLSLLAEIAPDRESLKALVQEMADRAIRGNELDAVSARLATALRGYGLEGVRALLERLEHLEEDKKETTIALLSTVFFHSGLPGGTSEEIAARLLDVYGISNVQVRLTILDCPFLVQPDVNEATRRALASALLDDLHEHRLEQSQDHIASVIRRLGPQVLPVLRRAVSRNRYAITRQRAAEIAGRIGSAFLARHFPEHTGDIDGRLAERLMRLRAGQAVNVMGLLPKLNEPPETPPEPEERDAEEIRHTLSAFLDHLKDDDYPTKSPLYVAAGRLAASGVIEPETLRAMTEEFLQLARISSDTYAIIEALGHLGIARGLPIMLRTEISGLLTQLLRSKYPEKVSRTRQTEDGIVYDLGHETTAYTDLLPRVMQGVQRMALTPVVDATMRQNLLETVLEAWNDLVEYRVIWSPQNITDLAEVLGQIGLSPLYEQHHRNRIIEAMMKKTTSLTVKSILGELIATGEDSARMAEHALSLFRELQDELSAEETLEMPERRAILSTMCRVALRERIGETESEAHAVRDEVVTYCMEAIRDGSVDLAAPLRELAERPYVEPELAEEIKRRLRRFKLMPA